MGESDWTCIGESSAEALRWILDVSTSTAGLGGKLADKGAVGGGLGVEVPAVGVALLAADDPRKEGLGFTGDGAGGVDGNAFRTGATTGRGAEGATTGCK
jgi:hypothetical protein